VSELLEVAVPVSFALLGAAMVLAFLRLARGPSLPDRVVALDLMAMLVVGFIAVHLVATDDPVLLDAALVLALVAFLGTVAFALYVAKRAAP
jgi:multicomponent Na+:H+ antiporter subunit F